MKIFWGVCSAEATMLERVASKASWLEQFAGRNEVSEAGDTTNDRHRVQHGGLALHLSARSILPSLL